MAPQASTFFFKWRRRRQSFFEHGAAGAIFFYKMAAQAPIFFLKMASQVAAHTHLSARICLHARVFFFILKYFLCSVQSAVFAMQRVVPVRSQISAKSSRGCVGRSQAMVRRRSESAFELPGATMLLALRSIRVLHGHGGARCGMASGFFF